MNYRRTHAHGRPGWWHCLALAFLMSALSCWAAPAVDGIVLVQSSRVDRTRFDYTYKLVVRVDSNSYRSASFSVASTSPATQVVVGVVPMGNLDAGMLVRSTSTFTLRQDRTVAFDPSALRFSFTGTELAPPAGAPQIGPITFLEPGGRAVHEGLFPMQQGDPAAGASLVVRATIGGTVASARYSLLATDRSLLNTGTLNRAGVLPTYEAPLTVPSQPFFVAIEAVGPGGETSTWTSSRTYVPLGFRVALQPGAGVLRKGERINAEVQLTPTTATGAYRVVLLLPAGFVASPATWDLILTPGSPSVLLTTLTAPAAGLRYQPYTIGVEVKSIAAPAESTMSNHTFYVE